MKYICTMAAVATLQVGVIAALAREWGYLFTLFGGFAAWAIVAGGYWQRNGFQRERQLWKAIISAGYRGLAYLKGKMKSWTKSN